VLGNGDDHRLVVGRRVDRADSVGTLGHARGDGSAQDIVDTRIVDTLEEDELGRVVGRGLVNGGQGLDDHVAMADNEALGIKGLGGRKVGLLGIGENTSVQVVDVQLRGEACVGRDGAVVLGEQVLGGRHVFDRGNETDGSRVA